VAKGSYLFTSIDKEGRTMTDFLAVFTGTRNNPRMSEWNALTEAERKAREGQAMAAWGKWMDDHGSKVVFAGGPLGKTKRASRNGIEDVTNDLAVFIVVRADSHDEAARLFENHPHFAIFPGEAIEVMPIVPIPDR
jgi:hypothetical protein